MTASRSSFWPTSRLGLPAFLYDIKCKYVTIQICYRNGFLSSATLQSYISAHPRTVLLDPLPAMTQLLDRFASYQIMTKLHNSLRGQPKWPSVSLIVLYFIAAIVVTYISCCIH